MKCAGRMGSRNHVLEEGGGLGGWLVKMYNRSLFVVIVRSWKGGKATQPLGDRADLADGALDTRVWVCVVRVTRLPFLLCRVPERRVRRSLLLEPNGSDCQ